MTIIKSGTQDIRKVSEAEVIAKINAKQAAVDNPAPIIEAKVEEPKVETAKQEETPKPEAKADAKADTKSEEPKEEKPKRAKDTLKPFSPKKADVVVEESAAIPESVKTKLSTFEKENQQYKSIIEDPDVRALLEAKKAGKSVIDLFKESIGNTVDASKMTDAQVYEHGLKANGVKAASELPADSEEPSLEEEMQKFKEMGKLAQKREADSIRKEIEASSSGQTDSFLNKLLSHNEKSESEAKLAKQKEIEMLAKSEQELQYLADSYVGQQHYGVTGTPDMAQSIKNFNLGEFLLKTDGSGIDAGKYFNLVHHILYGELVMTELENRIGSEKFDEYKKEVEVTKGASTGIVRAPQGDVKPKTQEEVINHIHQNMRPVSVGNPSIRR